MREFTITRMFDAPREVVFAAWTDPEQLTRWFGPVGTTTPRDSITADVRVGGAWQVTMINEESGERYPTGGVYREVVPPERLVFTWGDAAPGAAPSESVVTVVLVDRGDKTEMVFHQVGFDTDADRGNVLDGWTSAVDRLAELVRS